MAVYQKSKSVLCVKGFLRQLCFLCKCSCKVVFFEDACCDLLDSVDDLLLYNQIIITDGFLQIS